MGKEFTEKHLGLAKQLFDNMAPDIPQAEVELDNTAGHHDTMQAGAYTLMWDTDKGRPVVKVEVFMPSTFYRRDDPPGEGDILPIGTAETVEVALAMVVGHESTMAALQYLRNLNETEGN